VQCCDGSRSVLAAAGEGPEMQGMQEIVFAPSYSAYKQYYTGPFLKSLTHQRKHARSGQLFCGVGTHDH
jgi:hypothetical protein